MALPTANELQTNGGHDMNDTTGEPVGMWTRVSMRKQDEQSQVPDNMSWIRAHDYRLVAGATYEVHGRSAYKVNKAFDETWAKVLADFKSGLIRVLVVWKLDRLDRKLAALKMIAEVVALGSRVDFVTEPQLNDLSTMAGRISLKIAEEMAFAESQTKSDRIKIKHSALKAKGSFVGRPGWGLKVVPGVNDAGEPIKTLAPTAEGLKYARPMFEMVAANESLATVALWLTGHGVLTATGKTDWSPKTVGQIIRNHSMMGRRVDADGNTVHKFEGLVPIDLWDQANAALSVKSSRGPTNIANKSMLSGVMTCPKCSGPMYLIVPNFGTKGPSYRCSGRGPVRKSVCHNMISVTVADAKVNAQMLSDDREITKLGPAEGGELKLALNDVLDALKQLPNQGYDDAKEDAEKMNLRAERDRLTAEIEAAKFAPPKPVGTGQNYAQLWASLGNDNAAKNHSLKNSRAVVTGLNGTTDAEVRVICELKLAALVWSDGGDDGQAEQYTEIPPVVDGNWLFVAPGFRRRMRRAAKGLGSSLTPARAMAA